MKRRDFLYTGMAGAMAPVFIGGLGFRPMSASVIPSFTCDFSNRTLVIIYLAGANDIINTAVPLNQLAAYNENRPSIALDPTSLITLDAGLPDNQQLGLNATLPGLKDLYDAGKVKVIQRAGYPVPNRSHFASEDIMLKGIDGTVPNTSVESGWLGRFLQDRYPTYNGLPFGDQLDPLGIILGDTPATGFHTAAEHETAINLSGQDPAGFFNIISSLSGSPITQFANSEHGALLQYISTLEKSTQVYSERISSVFNAGMNQISTYPDTTLGDQLKTVARFLSGGSTTKVFMARKGGWDTHSDQVSRQTALLTDVSQSLKAFQDDLAGLGIEDQVTTLVFSEFSRKILQNGNGGTDHGTISSMFIIGKHVEPGVTGTNINLSDQDSQGAANPDQLQYDYRTVFASVLQDWLGASDTALTASFPNTPEEIVLNNIPIINTNAIVDSACYFEPVLPIQVQISLRLFLQGFMRPDGTMSTDLLANDLLPLTQPYGGTRYSYNGSEAVTAFPPDTVDWILLEIWNTDNIVLGRQVVLLRKDGWLTDLEGNQTIGFSDIFPEESHLVIFHRSHLGVALTRKVAPISGALQIFDITQEEDSVKGGGQLKWVQGKYAMIAGDVDQNGLVNAADYSLWKKSAYRDGIRYEPADLNADGLSDIDDFNIMDGNRSKIGYPETHQMLKNQ